MHLQTRELLAKLRPEPARERLPPLRTIMECRRRADTTTSISGVLHEVCMMHNWRCTRLTTTAEVFDLLTKLRGKRWLCRGQPEPYNSLFPKIDRESRDKLSRIAKLSLERESINLFRSSVRFLHPNEQGALDHDQDNIALMVLRHHGVPTRLLDWSKSPYVAAYFAASDNDKEGEIWTFDEPLYEEKGKQQWVQCPETTKDGSGHHDQFKAELTQFTPTEPEERCNWFICVFYSPDFPRQYAQEGAYTLTARFGRDHAEAIARLLIDPSGYHRYLIPATIKPELRRCLRERHGIWQGSLFPDTAGAAETASAVFQDKT
jgi:hypothetical protein